MRLWVEKLEKDVQNVLRNYKDINISYNMEKEPCIICFEENQEKIVFDCSHYICLVCYSKLLENYNVICPMCRTIIENTVKPISTSVAIPVHNDPNPINPVLILIQRDRIGWKGISCLISVVFILTITIVSVNYKTK
jgi:hypothetical protein